MEPGDAGVSRVGEVREVHHRAVDRRVEELAAVERRGRGAEPAAHSRRSDTTSASSSPWARASAHAATRG